MTYLKVDGPFTRLGLGTPNDNVHFRPVADVRSELHNRPSSQDWRAEMLKTLAYLHGQSFVRKPYKAYRPNWDHDHCAVCGVTLAEAGIEGGDIRQEGYATTSEYQHGEDYEWVCVDCFDQSKATMAWKDVTAV